MTSIAPLEKTCDAILGRYRFYFAQLAMTWIAAS
jgi:hypothetical protein